MLGSLYTHETRPLLSGDLEGQGMRKLKWASRYTVFVYTAGKHVCYLVNMKGNHDFLVVIGYHRSTVSYNRRQNC